MEGNLFLPQVLSLHLNLFHVHICISLVAQIVKNLPAMKETPGQSGRFPREENGNSLEYSWLENSMDRGAWRTTIHEVTELYTTERLTIHFMFIYNILCDILV